MAKNFKKRFLSGAGTIALALGFITVVGVTYAQNREGDIVTATANSGFFFDEKETTSWEFDVAAEACAVVEAPKVEPTEPPVAEEEPADQAPVAQAAAPVAQVVVAEQAMLAETGSTSVFGVLASGFLLLGAGTVLIARRKQESNI